MTHAREVSALIIIDMQNDFVSLNAPLCVSGARACVPRIREALDSFRSAGMPVFHVVREYREDASDVEAFRVDDFRSRGGCAVPGTGGCEIVEELRPLPGEYRIVKNRFSAFMNTELDLILRRLNIKKLVVCGTQYPNCIRATVFDAVAYDYAVTVLTDATSAKNSEIAEANILDMKNIGVCCVTVGEFLRSPALHSGSAV